MKLGSKVGVKVGDGVLGAALHVWKLIMMANMAKKI